MADGEQPEPTIFEGSNPTKALILHRRLGLSLGWFPHQRQYAAD